MEGSLHDLMIWLQEHSLWLAVAIFLTAFLETLMMVGLILPGVVMLFALATLAGGGALGIWPAMVCAFIGAVIGDTVSYVLGRRFHQQIKGWWPFSATSELDCRWGAFFSEVWWYQRRDRSLCWTNPTDYSSCCWYDGYAGAAFLVCQYSFCNCLGTRLPCTGFSDWCCGHAGGYAGPVV